MFLAASAKPPFREGFFLGTMLDRGTAALGGLLFGGDPPFNGIICPRV
jgi:hypothetical protein